MSFHMPVRGGSRGGKDQFEWEDVKADKYRENYLGQFRRLNWMVEIVGLYLPNPPGTCARGGHSRNHQYSL